MAGAQVVGLVGTHREPRGRKSPMLPANKSLHIYGRLGTQVKRGPLAFTGTQVKRGPIRSGGRVDVGEISGKI